MICLAELLDAAVFETEEGEPAIALSVGSLSGAKQMVLCFPTVSARDAWMRELKAKLPVRMPLISPVSEPSTITCTGNFVPDAGERILVSTGGVRIKQSFVTLDLTNTRFIVEGKSSVIGEFAVNTLIRADRLAGEVGEPGISLLIGGRDGEKEMHLLFPSMPERETWMEKFGEIIPKQETAVYAPESKQYSVTTVTPAPQRNTREKFCSACGARNPVDAEVCAMCGTAFGSTHALEESPSREKRHKKEPREPREPGERRDKREKVPYNGGAIGFVTRPSDAFAYYMRETPRDAVGMFFLSGALWAVISVLLLVYVVRWS